MLTATPFNALGAGNGFPFCTFKKDVSVYDYWTTLSGVNKGNPTPSPELIAESRRLAMKFYWNADSLICDATTSGTFSSDGSISTVQVKYVVTDDSVPAVPVKRTCIQVYDYSESDGSANAKIQVREIYSMYNGSTFVGYGLGYVETRFQSRGTIEAEAGNISVLNAGVYTGGYGYTPANTSNDAFDAGYVTFEGMELFAYVEAKNTPSNPSVVGSVNLSTLSAECAFQSNTTATASLDSIDFYTY